MTFFQVQAFIDIVIERFAFTFWLQKKKKLTFDKGHNAPVLLRLSETRIMLHFSMGHGGKVFPIHTFFKI